MTYLPTRIMAFTSVGYIIPYEKVKLIRIYDGSYAIHYGDTIDCSVSSKNFQQLESYKEWLCKGDE